MQKAITSLNTSGKVYQLTPWDVALQGRQMYAHPPGVLGLRPKAGRTLQIFLLFSNKTGILVCATMNDERRYRSSKINLPSNP